MGYAAELATMPRLTTQDPRSLRAGMRLESLRRRYPREYALLRAERDGEFFEQPEVSTSLMASLLELGLRSAYAKNAGRVRQSPRTWSLRARRRCGPLPDSRLAKV